MLLDIYKRIMKDGEKMIDELFFNDSKKVKIKSSIKLVLLVFAILMLTIISIITVPIAIIYGILSIIVKILECFFNKLYKIEF